MLRSLASSQPTTSNPSTSIVADSSILFSPSPSEIVVQLTQLNLLSPSSPDRIKLSSKRLSRHPAARKQPKLAPRYLAFDDDYFWELIIKDYASAWKYVARMTRMI